MFSVRDAIAPGLVTEFGGEFINSDHEDCSRWSKSSASS